MARLAIVAAAVVLVVGLTAVGVEQTTEPQKFTAFSEESILSETPFQAWCGQQIEILTATQLDPCLGAAPYFNSFFANLQSGQPFKKWIAANPGEWSRVKAYLADTSAWTGSNPAMAATRTFVGNFVRDAISACKIT